MMEGQAFGRGDSGPVLNRHGFRPQGSPSLDFFRMTLRPGRRFFPVPQFHVPKEGRKIPSVLFASRSRCFGRTTRCCSSVGESTNGATIRRIHTVTGSVRHSVRIGRDRRRTSIHGEVQYERTLSDELGGALSFDTSRWVLFSSAAGTSTSTAAAANQNA